MGQRSPGPISTELGAFALVGRADLVQRRWYRRRTTDR